MFEITDNAAKQFKASADAIGDEALSFRISARKSGSKGIEYNMGFDKPKEEDIEHGLKCTKALLKFKMSLNGSDKTDFVSEKFLRKMLSGNGSSKVQDIIMNKNMKSLMARLIFALVLLVYSTSFSGEVTKDFNRFPVKGTVTMIDLGAKKCIPCKMMAPIMKKLEEAYKGKADIVFIDVWENKEQAPRFKIRGIPTQIFFDKKGKEVYRHTGFLDESSIIRKLSEMGVPKPINNNNSATKG